MIPLFKSHYSLKGRSILKVDEIIGLFNKSKEEKLFVVEDNFSSFRKFNSKCSEQKIRLIFGLRLPVVQSKLDEKPSQLIFFAKNGHGIRNLRKIYSKCYGSKKPRVKLDWILQEELNKNLGVAVPFYDSYLYNNIFHFGMSHLDVSSLDPMYFEENNNHPHDHLISAQVHKNATTNQIVRVKSIYYENREDFKAFQTFKAICNRKAGRAVSFDAPGTDGLCSDEFCWEAYLEQK